MIELLQQLFSGFIAATIGCLVGVGFVTAGFALYDRFNR
jgi:hypothetical protein